MIKRTYVFYLALLTLLGVKSAMALELLSPAFKQGDKIPSRFTCDGSNISPPLFWKDAPAGTKSFVLIMDDPDAPNGTWDHWVIYNIPFDITSLDQNIQKLPEGAQQGRNSWNQLGYGGPCPPDKEHRYFFKLYAINTLLPHTIGLTKQEVENKIKKHVMATTELVGKYQRTK